MKSRTFRRIFHAMLRRQAAGKANPQEQEFLDAYYDHFEQRPGPIPAPEQVQELGKAMRSQLLEQIGRSGTESPFIRRRLVQIAAVAAAVLLVAGFYFLTAEKPTGHAFTHLNKQHGNDIAPGADAAMLTLSDGTKVVLHATGGSEIVDPAGVRIARSASGLLKYTGVTGQGAANTYNRIETPRGGQFRIILPDGTKVWLNAGSSLRYPAAFDRRRPSPRVVELEGEAYFEVAHHTAANGSRLPFKVNSNGAGQLAQGVEVLGTHFNINAYSDEPVVRTTLLEGRVRVQEQQGASMLLPGQQLERWAGGKQVRQADLTAAVAWKNNQFMFSNTTLSEILRQLGRWYNVTPETSSLTDKKRYSGMIGRNVNLSQVLKMLELTGHVRFTLGPERRLQVSTLNP
ncbi:anti-sigma factor [Pedobacter yulinensis]|uniref:Anti-sigma factor n=1 Tax=Pedobacter yulinensis TaxID=2126353 RepID=A0A2T3HGR5_9SPHI|nr:FecR family protein [Pedobacter yulinensis]PST81635.1 anti-sigma factor [Pedobacter yulinensis]